MGYIYYSNEKCFIIDKEYADKHELVLVNWLIENDIVQYTIFRDDNDCYFAVEGEY